jgi:hypothetical protein
MLHTIYAAKFEQYFYDGKVGHMYFYDGKVSRIDEVSVTKILCLHVLIARLYYQFCICWLFSVNIDVLNINNLVNSFILWLYHLA